MKCVKLEENAFKKIQLNAGVLLKTFTPGSPTVERANILGSTSGGVNFSAIPTYKDFGEDIDNCPKNMKQLKKLEMWEVTLGGTFVTVAPESGKKLLAAADIDVSDPTKIIPRNDVLNKDFEDIWWVGDYSDENGENNGGFIAIHMMNALSTGGFSLQTQDKEKGKFSFSFTAHYSIDSPEKVPFEIYIKAGTAEGVGV